MFARLKAGLTRTATVLSSGLTGLLTKQRLDAETIEGLEEALIRADLGANLAHRLAAEIAEGRYDAEISEKEIREHLATSITRVLQPSARPFIVDDARKPYVVLVAGVNGTGKTTTIGKLSNLLRGQGKQVLLCAADTFRAAAIDQLEVWGERTGTEVIKTKPGGDPAAVLFDALQAAKARNVDYVIIDTAGRLHTKSNLMAELEKMKRTAQRFIPSSPHEVLLVMDATTGQNGLQQAKLFTDSAGVTGIVLTKLDGTAKGGVVVAISRELGLPVRYVGIGEKIGDLIPFDANAFVESLFA